MKQFKSDILQLDKVRQAAREVGAKRVILFGSRSCGNAQGDSDVDLCLITDRLSQNILELKVKFIQSLRATGYRWKVGLDLHAYPEKKYLEWLRVEHPFIEEINKGTVIYG